MCDQADESDQMRLFERVSCRSDGKLLGNQTSSRRRLSNRAAKRACLFSLAALAVTDGAFEPFLPDNARAERIFSLMISIPAFVSIFFWCLYDAKERGYHINLLFRVLIVFCTCVGVPAYLLKTRGLRGFYSIGLAALFMVCISLLTVLAYIVSCTLSGAPIIFE